MTRGMNNLQANLCLLTVTLCWSCEVVIFSIVPDGINPFATMCVTSLIGACLLGACFARRISKAFAQDGRKLFRRVAALSVMNSALNVCFLIGLDYLDVSTGAFAFTMTAVLLPVMLLVMRRGVSVRTWLSAACVLVGLVVAMGPTFESSHLEGIAVMGLGCLIRAVYIVKTNDWTRDHDPVALSAGMLGLNAAFTFVFWFAMQPTTFAALPWSIEIVAAYSIYGYFVSAFASALNVFAQRRASAAQATIIFSTEIVLSTIWATLLPPSVVEPVNLTMPIVIGCALIVAGNLIEIIPVGTHKEEEVADSSVSESEDESIAVVDASADQRAFATDKAPNTLSRIGNPLVRNVVIIAILVAVYMVIATPFKVLEIIPGFTDIRPAVLLQPVYAIFFGIPGCIACAVGNLIADIASDSLRWSSIAGFVGNFLGPYFVYLFWTRLRKETFSLRGVRTIGLFVATVAASALIQALVITPAVAFHYPDVDSILFFVSVVLNNVLFPMGFAIPLIILLQEEIGFRPVYS